MWLETIWYFLLLVTAVPVIVLFIQVVSARQTFNSPVSAVRRPSIAVVVPAHNEAGNIVVTIDNIRRQLGHDDRLLVVAHNCTDNTASLAASNGATVIYSDDPTRRGKGYALHHGLTVLRQSPPEVVVVIDADCQLEDGAIDRIARRAMERQRPVQALYLMRTSQGASITSRITAFAWIVKNLVRPLGMHRAGLPCQLMGTGMAFPWSVISPMDLATGHLVEDMKLGLDLAQRGHAPIFCPEAVVHSQFAPSMQGLKNQKTRWEHGHIDMILHQVPRLLGLSVRKRNWNLLSLALDTSVAPLALQALVLIGFGLTGVCFFLIQQSILPLIFSTALGLLFFVAIFIAWWRFGRNTVSLRDLACGCFYVLWKLPLYAKFLFHRRIDWIRSQRDTE
ncbi:glycosyltransferase family 2 protein [Noviherbaspirillum malthae]|uniref:glycosyltransferase family 2 protein n=1 Tax=Noviherbaspirillum malthae TaxID=1260987 RepID=UPI00188E39C2|nr:glycosyltransferase family 2 protein [Noviherbaspirillum malthae]